MEEKGLQVHNSELPADMGSNQQDGLFLDVQAFEHAQRVAKMLASSTMVPEQFRNNVGNCMIALNFAARTRLDPAMVMQKMYIISGRPGIEGQLVIALINNSGRFTPLQFRFSGEGKSRQCTAFAQDIKSGQACEQTVTWEMVDAEGWDKKKGSKWLTMPDLMFQYRAAAFFGRLYCPEVLLGMMTKEELIDIERSELPKMTSLAGRIGGSETENRGASQESESQENSPLHSTDAWKKYIEAKEVFPEIMVPEPKTVEDCLKAVKIINEEADKVAQ